MWRHLSIRKVNKIKIRPHADAGADLKLARAGLRRPRALEWGNPGIKSVRCELKNGNFVLPEYTVGLTSTIIIIEPMVARERSSLWDVYRVTPLQL